MFDCRVGAVHHGDQHVHEDHGAEDGVTGAQGPHEEDPSSRLFKLPALRHRHQVARTDGSHEGEVNGGGTVTLVGIQMEVGLL